MNTALAAIFVSPLVIRGGMRVALLLPLCLSIALVYKTTKCDSLRELPLATLALWISIVAGMYAIGAGLWVLYLMFK